MYDGTQEVSFTYDANGMRKTKNTGSRTYTYTYNGSQLTQMTFLTSQVFYFTYDPQGHPATVKWNNHVYYYITNLQGDVIAIADQGVVVVEYKYDAWGKLLSITGSEAQMMGRLNPLRYRGYVYDQETGLYYLQSRYYNPEWGRFLNADALVSTGGLLGNNMYSYCWNNPVRYYDDLGRAPVETNLSDNAIDDLMDQNEVGGFATAPNSIDLGYTYHVNLSQAANSSVWGGGVYSNGYTAYEHYSNPDPAAGQSKSPRFSPDQQAVLDLAKDHKSGVTQSEAGILVEYANEYGISHHGPAKHENRPGIWGYTLHIKIKNYHIPVYLD